MLHYVEGIGHLTESELRISGTPLVKTLPDTDVDPESQNLLKNFPKYTEIP